MRKDYLIKQYSDADKKEALNLMQEVFASEGLRKSAYFSPGFWKWQYQDNPSGKAITLLAKDNGSVVGQYVNVPVHLKLNGKIEKSALVIDLMVRKPYRRQGLFQKMGEAANNRLPKLGVSISFAFPSRNESYAGFIHKLGWFEVGALQSLVKPVLPKIFKNKRKDAGIKVQKISTFPQEINLLWERLKSLVNIGVVRKSKYLNWRYFGNPASKYAVFLVKQDGELIGYFVLKITKVSGIKVGIIVDMFCVNELNVVEAVIDKANSYFLDSGAFLCTMLRTKLYERSLKKVGFRALPDRISPRSYSLIAKVNSDELDLVDLSNLDNWFLQFGDWDVV